MPKVADEGPLQRAGDVLLRPLAEEARDALRHVEHDHHEAEDREEDERGEPGPELHTPVAIGRRRPQLQTLGPPRYERTMADAPITLEGWYTLHDMYAVDWGALERARRRRAGRRRARGRRRPRASSPQDGHSACYSLLTQKGDLCFVHWRRDLESLRREETALDRTRLRAFLVPSYSYLAVIELGTYELAAHATAMLERRGARRRLGGLRRGPA